MLRQPALCGVCVGCVVGCVVGCGGVVNVTLLGTSAYLAGIQANLWILPVRVKEYILGGREGGQGASGVKSARCKVQVDTEVKVEGITEVKVQTHWFNKVSCVPYVYGGSLCECVCMVCVCVR